MKLSLSHFDDSPLTSAKKSTALFLVILLFASTICALGQIRNSVGQSAGAAALGAATTPTVQITPAPTPTPSPTLTIDPSQAARGGDPFKVTVKFAEGACKGNIKFKDKDHVLANKDELAKKNLTVDILEVPSGGCTLTANLTIGGDAPFGQQTMTFNLEDATTTTASVIFTVAKEEPLPPGPIPPGIRPQVDIMWAVVPQRIVKDNFGTRVGKLFYCVEVVIGNNTGYDLQIAAVAFKLGPVDEAAAAAFDMFKDAKEQINAISQSRIKAVRARNQAAEDAALAATLEAQAKILEIRAKQDKSLEVVARAVEARKKADEQNEIAKVTKTAAEAMQAAADEVTRNGQDVVKNNSEDIRNLTALSRQAYGQSLPVSSFRMARGSVEHGQFWSARGLTINTLKAFGPFLTGFTPYFHVINHQKNYSEAINIISNPLEKGFEAVIPDETVAQMQRLDEELLRDGTIIPNNRQYRTRVFIPKEVLRLPKKDPHNLRDNPMAITQALGEMILIGDQIAYINRVSVTSGGSGEVIPPPTVNREEKRLELNGDNTQTFIITGTNLQGATLTSDDPQNIPINVTSTTNTSLTANVTAKDTAELRTHVFHLFNGRGDIPIPVNLTLPAPTVKTSDVSFAANQAPTAYAAEDKTSDPITIEGRFLQGLKLLPLGAKPLPAPTIDSVAADGKSFKAKFTVPKGTPNGTYSFAVGNAQNAPDPNETSGGRLIKVTVGLRPAPVVKTVGYGKDGTGEKPRVNPINPVSFTVDLKGTDLNDLADTNPIQQDAAETPKITVGPVEAVSPTEVRVTMTAPANATPKTYNFKIFNKGSTAPSSGSFTVELQQQNAASIKNAAEQSVTLASDKTATLTLTGENLDGADATELPAGWTRTKDTASNATQLILKLATTNNITSETTITFKVVNLDTAHPVTVTLKVKPAPTP